MNACHPDADCYDTPLGPKCVCRGGYVGDGITCSAVQGNVTIEINLNGSKNKFLFIFLMRVCSKMTIMMCPANPI